MGLSPSDPVDWEREYVIGDTPWDQGQPLPLLVDAVADGVFGAPGTALVPGGGRGHDASALAAAGWHTAVVEISPTAAAFAAAHYPTVRYVMGDALDATFVLDQVGPVDLLWDHTFFCAVPPELRPRVGALAETVVKPGGLVASGVFPLDGPTEDGPPWGYQPADLDELLPSFELVHLSEPESIFTQLPFPHRLGLWRRTA